MNPKDIQSWDDYFEIIPPASYGLLKKLGQFENSILITGCQRSGTTILSEIIQGHKQIANHKTGHDSELDGALILAGYHRAPGSGRRCFQTTYINSSVEEYIEYIGKFKMVFVLRDPYSVTYSMLNNWMYSALDYVYMECNQENQKLLRNKYLFKHQLMLRKACYIYQSKLSQLFRLREFLSKDELIIIDYSQMVNHPDIILKQIFDFLDLDFAGPISKQLRKDRLKKSRRLRYIQRWIIRKYCESIYLQAKECLSINV